MDIKWIFIDMAFLVLFEVPQHHGGHDDIAVILWRDVYSLVSIFRAEVKSSMPRFRPLRSSLGPTTSNDSLRYLYLQIPVDQLLPHSPTLGLHRAHLGPSPSAVPGVACCAGTASGSGGHCEHVPTFFVLKPLDRYQSNSRHMCMLFHFQHPWRPEKHEINLVPYSKSKRVQISSLHLVAHPT